ncbi:MAG: hypothetical protein ABIS01_07225, partial [Ferruginibacter sp.]
QPNDSNDDGFFPQNTSLKYIIYSSLSRTPYFCFPKNTSYDILHKTIDGLNNFMRFYFIFL